MTTLTDSFYLERLKKYFDAHYSHGLGKPYYRSAIRGMKWESVHETILEGFEYHEETYKEFQVVYVTRRYRVRQVFDQYANPLDYNAGFNITSISSYGEPRIIKESMVYAYDLTTDRGNDELTWISDGAVIDGSCGSVAIDNTRKKALKQLDLVYQLRQVKDQLIALCDERIFHRDCVNPYNILVGDQLFIQAHGRLRKGLVIATTGSRFVVGYVTPSNHADLKYKIVRLGQAWVKTTP